MTLAITDEQQAAIDREQKVRRAAHRSMNSRARTNKDEARLVQAEMRERAIRANLDVSISIPARRAEKRRLAEVLAEQGRFTDAIRVLPKKDRERRTYFESLDAALQRPDDEMCACLDTEIERDGKREILPHLHVLAEVFSPRHSRVMPIVKCANCGFTNNTDAAQVRK